MFSKMQLKTGILSLTLIFTFIFNSVLPANAQGDFVTSGRIGGGSSVYVFRKSRKAKKSNYASKRRSRVRRTKKQRRVTRRKIARQSRRVAKRNRRRRNIKKITPTQFKKIELVKLTRQSKEDASKILAGAGEYFVENDDREKALGYLEQAIELDENNNDAKLALSEVYTTVADATALKSEEYAVLAAEAVKAEKSNDIRKYLTLEKFATQKVENDLKRAIELDDKNSSAYSSLGSFYDNKDDDEKAKEYYEKALELDSTLFKVKAPLGIIYYQEGMIDKADEYLSSALEGGEDNAEIQYFRGLIRYKQNKNDEAKTALETSISLDSDNAEAHYYLGAVLNRLDDEDGAIREFELSTTLDSTFVLAWFDLGVVYYNKEMYEKAIGAFDNAIRLNKNQTDEERRVYAESFANLAETYRQTDQFTKAIANYRNAVDLLNDPELYSTYGFVLAREEKWSDSIRIFEKVLEITPDANSYANLGWTHYQESQFHLGWNRIAKQKASLAKAKTALEKAIEIDSEFVASYVNLGMTLNDLGESKEAIAVLKKAVTLKKDWVFAVTELAKAYQTSKDYNNAIKEYKNAVKMDENYAYAYYGWGETEIARGKLKEAKKVQKKLQNLDSRLATKLDRKIRRAGTSLF